MDQHVAMKVTGHRMISVFQRYAIISEQDMTDATGKIELRAISGQSVNIFSGTFPGTQPFLALLDLAPRRWASKGPSSRPRCSSISLLKAHRRSP